MAAKLAGTTMGKTRREFATVAVALIGAAGIVALVMLAWHLHGPSPDQIGRAHV